MRALTILDQLISDLKGMSAIPRASRNNIVESFPLNIDAAGIYFDLGGAGTFQTEEAYRRVRTTGGTIDIVFSVVLDRNSLDERRAFASMLVIAEGIREALNASATAGNYANKGLVRLNGWGLVPHPEFPQIELSVQFDGFI